MMCETRFMRWSSFHSREHDVFLCNPTWDTLQQHSIRALNYRLQHLQLSAPAYPGDAATKHKFRKFVDEGHVGGLKCNSLLSITPLKAPNACCGVCFRWARQRPKRLHPTRPQLAELDPKSSPPKFLSKGMVSTKATGWCQCISALVKTWSLGLERNGAQSGGGYTVWLLPASMTKASRDPHLPPSGQIINFRVSIGPSAAKHSPYAFCGTVEFGHAHTCMTQEMSKEKGLSPYWSRHHIGPKRRCGWYGHFHVSMSTWLWNVNNDGHLIKKPSLI